MAHSVPRNRVSGPMVLGVTRSHPSASSPHPVLYQDPQLCLHCVSPSMCRPCWELPPSGSPWAPQPLSPCSSSQSDPSENKSGGANRPLRTFQRLSVAQKIKLTVFSTTPKAPDNLGPSHLPAQSWACLPHPHSRPTTLTCIQLLDHGGAKLSPIRRTYLSCAPVSMPG